MRKVFAVVFSMISLMGFATDWSGVAWLADGAGEGKYAEKYKVDAAFGQTVVNIQQPAWASEPGIYTNFPAGIESCKGLADGKYKVEGAGVLLFLSAFTAKETKVTITAGKVDYAFAVYYADGEGEVSPDPELETDPDEGKHEGDPSAAVYTSSSTAEILGKTVTFQWSITYNADKTLTFEISWDQEIASIVPQISIAGAYTTMPHEGRTAKCTTKETYNEGDVLKEAFFWMAYEGNAARINITGYKVGDSDKPQEDPDPSDPSGESDGSGESDKSGETEQPGETPDEPKGLDDVQRDKVQSTKVIENGVLYIMYKGTKYDVSGKVKSER